MGIPESTTRFDGSSVRTASPFYLPVSTIGTPAAAQALVPVRPQPAQQPLAVTYQRASEVVAEIKATVDQFDAIKGPGHLPLWTKIIDSNFRLGAFGIVSGIAALIGCAAFFEDAWKIGLSMLAGGIAGVVAAIQAPLAVNRQREIYRTVEPSDVTRATPYYHQLSSSERETLSPVFKRLLEGKDQWFSPAGHQQLRQLWTASTATATDTDYRAAAVAEQIVKLKDVATRDQALRELERIIKSAPPDEQRVIARTLENNVVGASPALTALIDRTMGSQVVSTAA